MKEMGIAREYTEKMAALNELARRCDALFSELITIRDRDYLWWIHFEAPFGDLAVLIVELECSLRKAKKLVCSESLIQCAIINGYAQPTPVQSLFEHSNRLLCKTAKAFELAAEAHRLLIKKDNFIDSEFDYIFGSLRFDAREICGSSRPPFLDWAAAAEKEISSILRGAEPDVGGSDAGTKITADYPNNGSLSGEPMSGQRNPGIHQGQKAGDLDVGGSDDGTKITADYRNNGTLSGEPLSAAFVYKRYGISGSMLSRDGISHRRKVGRHYVYQWSFIQGIAKS